MDRVDDVRNNKSNLSRSRIGLFGIELRQPTETVNGGARHAESDDFGQWNELHLCGGSIIHV